jgi:poly(3-hydroxybutyrate) depolymerase
MTHARRHVYAPRAGRALGLVAATLVALLALAAAVLTTAPRGETAAATPELPRLNVPATYVAGISSGGYMATQLQVAYSSRLRGAGVVSAGPYWCALGSVAVALESCTAYNVPSDLPTLYGKTDEYARDGKIDATTNLAQSRTWFLHGTKDPTVLRPVADNLATYYRHYGVPLTYRDTVEAGHGWISPLGPVACAETAPPYINNCPGYDAQADMLQVLRGSVKAPNTGSPRGTVMPFSQDPYAAPAAPGIGDVTRSGAAAIGMGSTGYLYAPQTCVRGAKCDVVVALHGCQQTADQIGTTFVERSGLNAYADTNSFVVLYPQATPDAALGNPKGCWDWWGYLGPGDVDYATKRGPQMQTVMAMVAALGG